jgi:hypothetical protein
MEEERYLAVWLTSLISIRRDRQAVIHFFFHPLILLATGVGLASADPLPGAADTTRAQRGAAGTPFVIPDLESEPSNSASPDWLTDPRLRPRGLSLLARSLIGTPLGVSWTRWADHGRPSACEPFRGQSFSISFEEYWFYQCTETLAGGKVEYFTYLLHEDREATLERARWSMARTGLDAREMRAIYAALVDTLNHVLGLPTPSAISGFGSAPWSDKWDFPHAMGTLTTYWIGTSAPTFGMELRSIALTPASNREEWDPAESSMATQDPEALREEVVAALSPSWPALGRSLRKTPSSIRDAKEWRDALFRVQKNRNTPDIDHDLVHVAAHLWVTGFGYEAHADTLIRHELESMRDLGVRLKPSHYVDFCYRGSLLESLVGRAGTNRWTDQALLSFQEMGWEKACDCGWDSLLGADQFRPVIERGEAFLKRNPNSGVWNEVALTVAQAHETAWSLAMGRCEEGDIGWDWKDYVLEAPRHREQAIELYERLLRQKPAMPGLHSARRRLQRLRLNVDTNYHPYWCVSD